MGFNWRGVLHLRQETAIPEPYGRGNRDDRSVVFRQFCLFDVVDLRAGNRGGLWACEAGLLTVPWWLKAEVNKLI